MIDREVFLSADAKSKLKEYERFVMAGKIISFYSHLPWEIDRPWSKEEEQDVVFGFGDGRKKLQERLADRTEAEKLLGDMDLVLASLPGDTKDLQRRTEDLALLHRYVNGEYSIYQSENPVTPRGRQISLSDIFAIDAEAGNDPKALEETDPDEAGPEDESTEGKEPLPELDRLAEDLISIARETDPYDYADVVNPETDAADDLKRDLTEGDTVEPQEPGQKARNYRIYNDRLGVGTPKERFRRNMDAIRLLKDLEGKKRNASPEEQDVLAGYVGWGGLADVFDEGKPGWKKEAKN